MSDEDEFTSPRYGGAKTASINPPPYRADEKISPHDLEYITQLEEVFARRSSEASRSQTSLDLTDLSLNVTSTNLRVVVSFGCIVRFPTHDYTSPRKNTILMCRDVDMFVDRLREVLANLKAFKFVNVEIIEPAGSGWYLAFSYRVGTICERAARLISLFITPESLNVLVHVLRIVVREQQIRTHVQM